MKLRATLASLAFVGTMGLSACEEREPPPVQEEEEVVPPVEQAPEEPQAPSQGGETDEDEGILD